MVIPDNGDGTPLYEIKPYSPKEWDWITAHMPRRKWGVRVAYVAPQTVQPSELAHKSRFYRTASWWFSLPGKWLPLWLWTVQSAHG